MFGDSLLEVPAAQRVRKGWITAGSMALQALAMGCLLLIPLLKPVGLSLIRTVPTVTWQGVPRPVQIPQSQSGSAHYGSIALNVPHSWSFHPRVGTNEPDPPSGCVICSGAGRSPGPAGLPFSIGGAALPMPAVSPTPIAHPPHISRMMEGNLITQVKPQYPPMARTARIEGQVVLRAVIGRDGTIQNLRLISGHPLLVKAAIDAVSRWRYRPYYLNGEPIEVETQVTVNFTLNH